MKIVKNLDEIIKHKTYLKERKYILSLLEKSIMFSKPEYVIRRSVKLKKDILYIMNERFNIMNKKIFVIGFGKAALDMGKGIKKILKDRVNKFIIISPEKYVGDDFEFYRSSHPYPNYNSIRGTKRVISLIRKLKKDDLVIFLISGGGSSSLVLPEKGISLKEKIMITKKLIESGADIEEINAVRKLLSAVKGGKLAEMCEAQIINLIISDVVGDRIDMISSGPTVENMTDLEEVLRVVKKFKIDYEFPQIRNFIRDDKLKRTKLKNVNNFIMLKNIDVLKEIKKLSKINSTVLTSRINNSPDIAGKFLSSVVEKVFFKNIPFKKPVLIISGGETEVNLKNKNGKGGPNQELCLYFLLNLSKRVRFVFTSIDTDGKDGSSDYAGGIVDNYTLNFLNKKEIIECLKNHNSEFLLEKSKDLILTNSTGTNVNDIQITYIF